MAQDTQAFFFMQVGWPSEEQLLKAGATFDRGMWTFPDGSRGRFLPPQGRFMPVDDTVQEQPPRPEEH